MTSLFDPIQVGDIALANRIVMAPLTRNRAIAGNVAGPLTLYWGGRSPSDLYMDAWVQTQREVVSPSARTPPETASHRSDCHPTCAALNRIVGSRQRHVLRLNRAWKNVSMSKPSTSRVSNRSVMTERGL